MSPIQRTQHAVYELKYHFVWIPKYRKKLLKGDVATFIQQVLRRIAEEYGWEIEEMAVQTITSIFFSTRRPSMGQRASSRS